MRSLRVSTLLLCALALAGCRGPDAPVGEGPRRPPEVDAAPADAAPGESPDEALQETPEAAPREEPELLPEREADPMLRTGMVLRDHREGDWGLRLLLPLVIGLSDFQLGDGLSLDHLATVALVPTAEVLVPLSERWTLQPFVGLGLAYQTGTEELVGGTDFFGLADLGLRATRWQRFAERHWFGLTSQLRYEMVLSERFDRLDDWGSLELALELRRDFGRPSDSPRLQAGVYAQGFYTWNEVELDISGVTPIILGDQLEVGISVGSTRPFRILGITLPTVFLGAFVGGDLRGFRIRTVRL